MRITSVVTALLLVEDNALPSSLGTSYFPSEETAGVIFSSSSIMATPTKIPSSFSKSLATDHLLRGGSEPKVHSTNENSVPLILRPWIRVYHAVPKVYVPFTKLNANFILLSTLLFILIDFGAAEIFRLFGWPYGSKEIRAAGGSMASVFHATTLVASLGVALWTQQVIPSEKMDAYPQWWQDTTTSLILYCTGYMLYDTIIQFGYDRWVTGVGFVLSNADWCFLGHHFACTFYMVSTLLLGSGHVSALMLMFSGEFTSPIHNIFRVTRMAISLDCCSGPLAHNLHSTLRVVWAVQYAFFRIIVGPACAAHITYDLLFTKRGRQNVPIALSFVWLFMGWGVLIGSIPWIIDSLKIVARGKGGILE